MRYGVIRICLQCLLVLSGGCVFVALLHHDVRRGDLGVGIVRVNPKRLPELQYGLIRPSGLFQGVAEVEVCAHVSRIGIESLSVLLDRLVILPLLRQRQPVVAVREGAAGSDLDHAPEQRVVALPVPNLRGRDCGKREQDGRGDHRKAASHRRLYGRRTAGPRQKVRHAPGNHDPQPDHRDVHVPVGHRLLADLHEAYHRDERDDVPEPADDQVRPRPREADREQGHRRQEQRGGDHAERRHSFLRIRIVRGETRRVESLPDVRNIRCQGVGGTQAERELVQPGHGLAAPLG